MPGVRGDSIPYVILHLSCDHYSCMVPKQTNFIDSVNLVSCSCKALKAPSAVKKFDCNALSAYHLSEVVKVLASSVGNSSTVSSTHLPSADKSTHLPSVDESTHLPSIE